MNMPECMCICKSRCRCRSILYVYKLDICVFLHLRCCCVFPCSHPPMTQWPKPNRWPHGYLWRLWSLHDSISLIQDLGQKFGLTWGWGWGYYKIIKKSYIYMHIMCKITSLESPTSTWYWILASFTEHDDDKWWQWCWFIFRWVALRRAVFLALTVMFMPLSIFALLHRYVQRGTFSSGTSTMMWHRRMTTCSEAEG